MKTITKLSLALLLLFSTSALFSQALITDEETPAPINDNALLEIRSTNPATPGVLLIPKLNLQKSGAEVVLPNLDDPVDGMIIYNIGGEGDTDVDKGLWYYDGDAQRWVIFSNYTSVFALDPGNYGELFQTEPIGSSDPYTIYSAYWTPWNSASTPDQLGDNFEVYGSALAPEVLPDYPTNGQFCTGLSVQPDGAGKYQVNVTATIEALSSGIQLIGALFVNGEVEEKVNFRFNFQTSNDVASLAASGIIELNDTDIVDFRFKSESATENIGIISLNMSLTKIDGLD